MSEARKPSEERRGCRGRTWCVCRFVVIMEGIEENKLVKGRKATELHWLAGNVRVVRSFVSVLEMWE